MSIEKNIERIADALERIANRYDGATGEGGEAGEPSKPTTGKGTRGRPAGSKNKPKEDADDAGSEDSTELNLGGDDDDNASSFLDDDDDNTEAEELTKDKVREKLVNLQTLTNAATAMDVIKRVAGAESLGKVPEKKYAAVVAECDKLIAKAKKGGKK